MKITIRPMSAIESTLVLDSWTRSLDGHSSGSAPSSGRYIVRVGDTKLIGWSWFEMHRAWVHRLLEQPDTTVIVATLEGHDEAIGWCAYSKPGRHPLVVHYVYTLAVARHRGVGEQLLARALAQGDNRAPRFSHQSPLGSRIADKVLSQREEVMSA